MDITQYVIIQGTRTTLIFHYHEKLVAIVNVPLTTHDDIIRSKYFPRYWPFFAGKLTGHRWIPLTNTSDAELWYFFDIGLKKKRLSKKS